MSKRKSQETPAEDSKRRSEDSSKRRPGFGSIETRDQFEALFGETVKLPLKPDNPSQAGLHITTQLADDAASYLISSELAPALALCRSILRIRNEKARYLVIYEVLKVFAKLARGRLILEARTVEEALDDEQSQDEGEQPSPSAQACRNKKQKRSLTTADTLLVGFEETLAGEKLSGPVEFLVYAGSDTGENGPIRFVCEAKPSLELYWGKATWQFLAQLTTAAQTWGSHEVYGALTDALEWHFFRITKIVTDTKGTDQWMIEAAMPLRLADSVFDALEGQSTKAVTMLLQCLFANKVNFDLEDLIGSLGAADNDIRQWADRFTEQAGKVSELLVEIAKLKAQLESARQ